MRPALVTLTLLATGCGSPPPAADPGPPLVPTSGEAFAGGKPAAGALLLFHPAGGPAGAPPRARVGADGKFAVASADGRAGLPAGDYAVTVDWRAGAEENGEPGRSMLPGRYAQPTTTPVRAAVRPGPDGTCAIPTIALTN